MRLPTAASVLGELAEHVSDGINVSCPGRVTRWDVSTQQVDVQPLIQRGYLDEDGERQLERPPVVCSVPVVSPHAKGLRALKTYLDALELALSAVTYGGYAGVWAPSRPSVPSFVDLALPVAVGDTGLLIFSDRSLDVWLATGGIVDPGDDRRHALSDAVFVPGLRPFSSPLVTT